MAGMQPPTISGPNAASGPVNGLNSPTTNVAGAEPPPPDDPQAPTAISASAAPAAVTANLITHLRMMRATSSAPRVRRSHRSGGAAGQWPRFLPKSLESERADLDQRARGPGIAEVAAAQPHEGSAR